MNTPFGTTGCGFNWNPWNGFTTVPLSGFGNNFGPFGTPTNYGYGFGNTGFSFTPWTPTFTNGWNGWSNGLTPTNSFTACTPTPWNWANGWNNTPGTNGWTNGGWGGWTNGPVAWNNWTMTPTIPTASTPWNSIGGWNNPGFVNTPFGWTPSNNTNWNGWNNNNGFNGNFNNPITIDGSGRNTRRETTFGREAA